MLEIKEYTSLFLNEVRGAYSRNVELIKRLLEICELIEAHDFFEFISNEDNFTYIPKLSSPDSDRNDGKCHDHSKVDIKLTKFFRENTSYSEIRNITLELLNEKKREVLSSNDTNIYSFSSNNEHVKFVKDKFNNIHNINTRVGSLYYNPSSSNKHGYSILLYKKEELELQDGTRRNLNDYIVVTLRDGEDTNARGSWVNVFNDVKEKNVEDDYNSISRVYLNLDYLKKGLWSILRDDGRPRLNFLFRDIMLNLENKYSSREDIKRSISSIYSNSSLTKEIDNFYNRAQNTFGHELQHHSQWINYFKASVKSGKKPNPDHGTHGLPELPGTAKDYPEDPWFNGRSNPRHYRYANYPHEYRAHEFYPRLSDCFHLLKLEANNTWNLKDEIHINVSNKKFDIENFASISFYKNKIFTDFIKENAWFKSLRNPHRFMNIHYPKKRKTSALIKKAKRYYKKAALDLYVAFDKFLSVHKSKMIKLLKQNETKIIKEIKNFKQKGLGIYISYNYLKSVDELSSDHIPSTFQARKTFRLPQAGGFDMEHVKLMINKFESADPESKFYYLDFMKFKDFVIFLGEEIDYAIEIDNPDRLEYLHKVLLYLADHFDQYYGGDGEASEIADFIIGLIDQHHEVFKYI